MPIEPVVQEIVTIGASGKVVKAPCVHLNNPEFASAILSGLDASFCQLCQTWWVDQQRRDIMVPPKKKTRTATQTQENFDESV